VCCGKCTKERDRRKKVREVVDDVMGKRKQTQRARRYKSDEREKVV